MPYIVQGEPSYWREDVSVKDDYGYNYPNGLDLRPGSDLHCKLRSKIWQRAQESRNEMSKRYDSWREIDRSLTTYMPAKDADARLKKSDPSKPISIVFPYSYSVLESLLTYLTSAFFQDPMFQYEGVEDDDTIGAMLMELVIRLHCIKNKVPLNVHTMLRDSLAYGIGPVIPGWRQTFGRKPVRRTTIVNSPIGDQVNKSFDFEEAMLFEGNDLTNIDPYMWLPDPSVSVSEIQKGEFIGWVDRDNIMNLLSEEGQPGSDTFNVKYLKGQQHKKSVFSLDESDRQSRYGGSTDLHRSMSNTTHPIDSINMYIKIIPSEWGLGKGEYPEKWFFKLSSDSIITCAMKAEHNHGMFPTAVAAPEYDGYSISPIGRMEVLYGLQHTLDFLFNSHIANVRKAVNDMLVVDPYLINIEDLKDPQPGKIIRLRRPAWGHGVKDTVQQLNINDITRLNIADAGYVTGQMDRISGADQSMQGALRMSGPERLTGAEFNGTRGSAMSRLQRLAMVIGMQAMQDIGTMFAVHTQQYMTQDTYVRITGKYADQLAATYGKSQGSIKVTPYDLSIDYDMIVRDGSIPGGNFSDAWIDMWKTIAADPELRQIYDSGRIFSYIATQLGAKNVEDFKKKPQQLIQPSVMPDEQVQQQVQAGNLVPTSEAIGAAQ